MLNILLVDDHSIIRAGLKYLLENIYPDVNTEEVGDGSVVLDSIRKTTFDLVIMDSNLRNTDSFTLINRILAESRDCKILLFSLISDYGSLKRYIRSGVMGYVGKNSENDDIVQAIKTILSGKKYVGQEIMNAILDDKFFQSNGNPFNSLSEREYEIAKRLLTGDNITTIAQMLNIHTSTVGTHKSKVFAKLKVNNMVELMALARNYELN